jgi:hypothetical protein
LQQCNLTLDDKGLGILGTIVGKPFFKKLWWCNLTLNDKGLGISRTHAKNTTLLLA